MNQTWFIYEPESLAFIIHKEVKEHKEFVRENRTHSFDFRLINIIPRFWHWLLPPPRHTRTTWRQHSIRVPQLCRSEMYKKSRKTPRFCHNRGYKQDGSSSGRRVSLDWVASLIWCHRARAEQLENASCIVKAVDIKHKHRVAWLHTATNVTVGSADDDDVVLPGNER